MKGGGSDLKGGWQDLDIAACIPEATGLISNHDNVPRNVDSPPLSSIARRESIFVESRAESGNYAFLEDRSLKAQSFSFFKLSLHHCILTRLPQLGCRL